MPNFYSTLLHMPPMQKSSRALQRGAFVTLANLSNFPSLFLSARRENERLAKKKHSAVTCQNDCPTDPFSTLELQNPELQ